MDTLVLSQSYFPIARISWKKAISLLFQNKIEVIAEYDDREIRSVSLTLKLPSIVRFIKNVKLFRKQIKFSRENVYTRDKGKCQYCFKNVPRNESTYDHVLPRSLGGLTSWENIVISCMRCNQYKGGRTPEQANMKLKTKPSKPEKLPNFCNLTLTWKDDMPLSWKDFLISYKYWHEDLQE